jgi:hypothetical protein
VIQDERVERGAALTRMREAATLWSVGQTTAGELVSLACELLVAGFDGPDLAMLAGVHARHADEDVPGLLEGALEEVGIDHFPAGSPAGTEAAVRLMASRVLAGSLAPRDLAAWAHSTVGHRRSPLAERLVELDDVYDILDYTDMTEQEADDEVRAEARRIVVGTVPAVDL